MPLINSEQMYQALRRLGVATELVVYPDQSHGIETPSYQKDRLERYLAWYDRFLRPGARRGPGGHGAATSGDDPRKRLGTRVCRIDEGAGGGD